MTTRIQLTPEQEQKLRELGSYLREIRLRRSLSLESIALRTRIQARLLRALENVDTKVLPEPVYVRALLKQYADALDLEGDALASAFPADTSLRGLMPSWKHLNPNRRRPFRLYLVYILALISVISGVSILMKRSAMETAELPADIDTELPSTEAEASPPGVTASQGVGILAGDRPAVPEPEAPDPASTAAVEANGKVVVSLKLQDECWLRVVADGQVAFEGILTVGEQRTWKADEQITIVAGNAGGVAIAINDQEARPLGAPGSVETVTYRQDGDPSPS